MLRQKFAAAFLLTALLTPVLAFGQSAQTDAVGRIRDEGMNRSQAMNIMRYLSDVIGARLTNSPAQRRSNQWTKEQFQKWGLQNAVVESWGEFGRGWELKRFNASLIAPEYQPFRAYPKAWSPSTPGAVTGDVVYVAANNEAELEKYKGKLKGAIVLVMPERKIDIGFQPDASRNTDEALAKLASAVPQVAQPPLTPNPQQVSAFQFNARKFRFYHEEGAAVLVEPSQTLAGTIRVMGAAVPSPANPIPGVPNPQARSKNAPPIIPQIVAEAEQYNRVLRLVRQNIPVRMMIDLDVQFFDDDLNGYNTIAEIPGTDLKDEVVMIGAHLDSWHGSNGSTDNGAGVTVVMEAVRILQAAGLKPRRTIRVGLWTGEEQGLLGSRGYVAKHLATIGDGSDAAAFGAMSGQRRPITKRPGYDKFAAYYNLDNGTGRIRGVYMQGNENVRPIFRDWLAPFGDWGSTTLTINNTGGTDHLAFDAVGLPGFQFIQDPIEYFSRTWHTTQDVADRTIENDLKQSAVIMAAFAYNSAMSQERIPRKTNPMLDIRAMIRGASDEARMDEIAFRNSGLNFSVCGHPLEHDEIPIGFPGILAIGNSHNHALGE
jgi:carboxypeptidase Q